MTVSKSLLLALLLALPWWVGATPGSLAQMGAWLAAACVLSASFYLQISRSWPQSLVWAALVSVGLGLLQYAGLAASLSPWVSESVPGEVVAHLRQRNQFASLMAMGVLALLYGLQAKALEPSGMRRAALKSWALWLAIAMAALLAFGNALSGSRTGLLQWLALAALAWGWRHHGCAEARWVLWVALLGFVLGVLLAPWLASLAGHTNAGLLARVDDSNAFSRIALWSNVLELIAREPLLGHGWRSLAYVHYSSEFSSPRFMEMLDNAHNLPLHLAMELGLPVAFAFCGLVAWVVWKNKPWAETHADRQLAWGVLLVIGIHSMLEYPLWYGPFFMTALIAMGILCSDLWRNWLLAGTDTARNAIILGVRGFALLLLAATAFVAFDYHRVSQIYLASEERSSWYAADPLAAAKQSVFFQSHAKFAELQITPLSKESAPRVLELSSELVRWSPEPRIIEKLIESAVMMGLDDVAAFHLKRYRVNYPMAYAAWAKRAL